MAIALGLVTSGLSHKPGAGMEHPVPICPSWLCARPAGTLEIQSPGHAFSEAPGISLSSLPRATTPPLPSSCLLTAAYLLQWGCTRLPTHSPVPALRTLWCFTAGWCPTSLSSLVSHSLPFVASPAPAIENACLSQQLFPLKGMFFPPKLPV